MKMIQRNKQKTGQDTSLSLNTDSSVIINRPLKNEPSVRAPDSDLAHELDSSVEAGNKDGNEFETMKRTPKIKTTSTSDYLKVVFIPVEGAFSGYFQATSKRGHQLEAVLEDDANHENPVLHYKGVGEVRTIVVPVGKIGDRAFFKVTDGLTGAEATGEAVTIPLCFGIWNRLKGFIKWMLQY